MERLRLGRSLRRLRPIPILLGLVAGGLICLALPPWGWWPLAPVGIALWLHLLGSPSRLQRFAVSYAVGLAWFAPSTLWMWGLTPPGYVAAVLIGWGPLTGAIGIVCPGDRRRLAALPAAIVLFEWFHSHAPFGGVPLSLLAMTQTRAPLLPTATLIGGLGLSAVVAVLGVALYLAAFERRWREPVAIVAAAAVLAVGGALWPAGTPSDELRVAVVQGGGPQGTRFAPEEAPRVYERHITATREIDASRDLDLVLWPENAINVDGAFADSPWYAEISTEAQRLGATIITGVVEDAPGRPDEFLNYVVAFEPNGDVDARYDKERRVPFGEYVPMRWLFDPIAKAMLPPRDQVPGVGNAAVHTESGTFAMAISWEVFFSRRVREGVRGGGEMVLNPTNGSSYWLTQVQTQQLATSALRATESRRYLLQAAPTGFSAVFDSHGRILQETVISEQATLFATVPQLSGTTPAQALGDLPALLAAAAALLLVGRPRWRRFQDLERSVDHEE